MLLGCDICVTSEDLVAQSWQADHLELQRVSETDLSDPLASCPLRLSRSSQFSRPRFATAIVSLNLRNGFPLYALPSGTQKDFYSECSALAVNRPFISAPVLKRMSA